MLKINMVNTMFTMVMWYGKYCFHEHWIYNDIYNPTIFKYIKLYWNLERTWPGRMKTMFIYKNGAWTYVPNIWLEYLKPILRYVWYCLIHFSIFCQVRKGNLQICLFLDIPRQMQFNQRLIRYSSCHHLTGHSNIMFSQMWM